MATTKTAVQHAFEFLEASVATPLPPVVACFGSDDFLRRSVIHHVIASSGIENESIRSFDGDESQWRDVHDQLATRSLFDNLGGRVAVIRNADKFITKFREQLERWIDLKAADCTLILDIQTFPATTKLYNLVSKLGISVKCTPPQKSSWGNPPDDKAMQKWILQWGSKKHRVELSASQSALMVERIGAVCGLIDCELAKLALFADTKGKVADERVAELVGGWRTQTAWEVADAIADGKVAVALEQLEKLSHAGQNSIGLAAQVGWSLRRFGVAARIVEIAEKSGTKIPLGTALEKAGFNRFDLAKAEARLRRIGRVRAKELLNDLVRLELQLKGSHSNEHRARFALESLIVSLA
jgi:DNA polymerase III subunit delta